MVNGDIWSVVFKKRMEANLRGFCDPEKMEIAILIGQSGDEIFKTFIHEVFHAFEFSYDFEMNHKTIYKLEDAVLNLLKDNF